MAKAAKQGTPMCIAVVDDGGNLKAFVRIDRANLGSLQWSINKAVTAASFQFPTHELMQGLQSGPALVASMIKLPNATLVPAGYPLQCGQMVVGGIGTGGAPEQDQAVAEAGCVVLHGR
jgi:uncharacterized protein GlcG (DUF336 family)